MPRREIGEEAGIALDATFHHAAGLLSHFLRFCVLHFTWLVENSVVTMAIRRFLERGIGVP